ncbi:MAG: hypothetical protein MUD14_08750 [Hydrococcus sp. Prado102]|nr:hypothetical protein [Hydrococcus sp. Prado102]
MNIDIATINALLLPPTLFIAFFCFACCLLHDYQAPTQAFQQVNLALYKEAFSSKFDPEPDESESFYEQVFEIIARLNKQECRRLCSPRTRGGLGIQMKANGTEKSTQMLRAAIRQAFKTEPENVIAVIRDRTPDKFPKDFLKSDRIA